MAASGKSPRYVFEVIYIDVIPNKDQSICKERSFITEYHVPNPFTKISRCSTQRSKSIFAVRLLEQLRKLNIETHLVMSKWASVTLKYETDLKGAQLRDLATFRLAAPISRHSFLHDGMIIVPYSMKTLAAVQTGFCGDSFLKREMCH